MTSISNHQEGQIVSLKYDICEVGILVLSAKTGKQMMQKAKDTWSQTNYLHTFSIYTKYRFGIRSSMTSHSLLYDLILSLMVYYDLFLSPGLMPKP